MIYRQDVCVGSLRYVSMSDERSRRRPVTDTSWQSFAMSHITIAR